MSESYIDNLLTPRIAEVIELSSSKSRIVLEPLEQGFGHTLGNSLRRILLSAITGSAVSEVKIEGVQHEYAIIDGVREDVIDIMLNLKQLIIKMPGMKTSTATLNKKGPTTVTAGDIELSGDVEILNKDHVIAHLSEGGALEMEMTIEQGRGYRLASEVPADESRPVGTLLLDASFCPVKSVVYSVEKTRVGQRIDLDKLLIDIEVAGTIDAKEAVQQAATILHAQLAAFVNLDKIQEMAASEREEKEVNPMLDKSIKDLEEFGLTPRSVNALLSEKIMDISELVKRTEANLLETPNIGMKSVEEIKDALKQCGLELGMGGDMDDEF